MSNQELIDRYVYAVVKHLPRKQAEDIDRELHGLVEDMLAERCQDRPIQQKDVLVVLTELGTPREMAAQYDTDTEKCLISQPYYSQYKIVLKWVLFALTLGISISMIVSLTMSAIGGELDYLTVIRTFASSLGGLISGWFGAIGAVTLVYAVMDRKGVQLEELGSSGANLMELPPIPRKKEKISRTDAIFEIILSILFLCIFLLMPQIICAVFEEAGGHVVIPVFNLEVLKQCAFLFVGISLCGVVTAVFKLMEGRYTMRLAAVVGIANLLSILFMLLFVTRENLLNPALLDRIAGMFAGEEAWLGKLFENVLWIFAGVVVISCVIEFAEALYRALKYRQK